MDKPGFLNAHVEGYPPINFILASVIWGLPIIAVSTLCLLFNYFSFLFKITVTFERFFFSLIYCGIVLIYQLWKLPGIFNVHEIQ